MFCQPHRDVGYRSIGLRVKLWPEDVSMPRGTRELYVEVLNSDELCKHRRVTSRAWSLVAKSLLQESLGQTLSFDRVVLSVQQEPVPDDCPHSEQGSFRARIRLCPDERSRHPLVHWRTQALCVSDLRLDRGAEGEKPPSPKFEARVADGLVDNYYRPKDPDQAERGAAQVDSLFGEWEREVPIIVRVCGVEFE